jgi:hypothetical protein
LEPGTIFNDATRVLRTALKPVQIFAAVMILIGVLVYFSHQDMLLIGDGQLRYNALADLIERHRFTSTPYSMVMPLCALPLYLLPSSAC